MWDFLVGFCTDWFSHRMRKASTTRIRLSVVLNATLSTNISSALAHKKIAKFFSRETIQTRNLAFGNSVTAIWATGSLAGAPQLGMIFTFMTCSTMRHHILLLKNLRHR